jgi:glycosyltransferase 2 family protein
VHPTSVGDRRLGIGRLLRLAVGGLLAAGFLALAFRKVDPLQLRQVVLQADVGLLLAALAVGSSNLLLRAARWRVLLSGSGKVPFPLTFWVMTVGYLGNSLLPMRAGDLGRSYLIGQRAGMGGTFALATTVAERVLDAGFLVIVGGLSLLSHPLVPDWLSRGLVILAIVSGVGLAVLLAMPRVWDPLAARLEQVPRLTSTVRRLRERWLDRFFEGLASIRHPGRMALFLALTCALWFLDAVGVVLVARALGVVLSIPSALVVLSALGASSAVPLTPGQVGVFQWVASSVLGSYGVAPEPAVIIAIGLQATNYIVLLAWGTAGVFRLGGPEILRVLAGSPARRAE